MHYLPILVIAGLLAASPAAADYYRYTDSKGTVSITNDIRNVPEKYRKTMKVIRDEDLAKKDRAAAPAVQAPAPSAAPVPQAEAPAPPGATAAFMGKYPWAKPLVFVAGGVAFLFLFLRLLSALPPGPLGRVIALVFFVGVGLFGFKMYSEHLVAGYFTTEEKILAMFRKSQQREAPDQVKALDGEKVRALHRAGAASPPLANVGSEESGSVK
ncbi:MAG TPA: DUF4124 domain-containing protein [Verrucomicrobiae bacterium]|nr:DUF4124 domain-containing protein [Verrucomicrobiae bacterium]